MNWTKSLKFESYKYFIMLAFLTGNECMGSADVIYNNGYIPNKLT